MHEWSLILFTLLIQSAVGLVVVGEAIRISARGEVGSLLSRQIPVACALAGLGSIISLTHLGTPLHSFFTIANLGSSWLSREIISSGLFFALLVLVIYLNSRNIRNRALLIATAVVGLIAVFVMSRVYLLRTVPVWDSGATTLSFFGTMFFMGAVVSTLLMGLELRANSEKSQEQRSRLFGTAIIIAAFGLTLQFIGIPLSIVAGSAINGHGLSALNTLFANSTGMLSLRIALLAVGGFLFAWAAVRAILKSSSNVVALGMMATLCVMAGEVIGRLMFYASYTRIGL